jgi:adenylate cyclase
MATFGAPISSGNDCQDAVAAASDIIDQLNTRLQHGELPPTDVGIGLHYGEAVTGNVGTDLRKQYSVTGNVVILASRIEQLNKQYGSRLLISREVLNQINIDHLKAESLGFAEVKGRSQPIEIFKLA